MSLYFKLCLWHVSPTEREQSDYACRARNPSATSRADLLPGLPTSLMWGHQLSPGLPTTKSRMLELAKPTDVSEHRQDALASCILFDEWRRFEIFFGHEPRPLFETLLLVAPNCVLFALRFRESSARFVEQRVFGSEKPLNLS
mmetsp:Transcript_1645/g.2683  ORF Transcript_1645/g.2683 Transcript_1645/m.2683 type:complete len:143 (+) Transcript_1645:83-511(+)